MLVNIFLCIILFIPLIYSSNTTISKLNLANNTQPINELHNSSTKAPVLTESGAPLLIPVKDKHTNLMTLENETSINKEKPVMPRKGVVYTPIEDNHSVESEDNKLKVKNANSTKGTAHPHWTKMVNISLDDDDIVKIAPINNSVTNNTKNINASISTTVKTLVHKPIKTSYDELANAPIKSSPEAAVNQLPSPNRESKIYAASVNSHPGMVMPLVITILLVPMFAVLGYMALKKGQEAWKNRHYKRVDFLLDGMYND